MSVRYILDRVGIKVGLNPDNANQRETLLRILNEAAPELYAENDAVGVYGECIFQINGDQTIAFPEWLGYLRAAREWDTQTPWHVNQMRPRYNVANWRDGWRNFRIKNRHALCKTLTNSAPLTVTVPAVENPPIEVTIAGPTATATSSRETLVMDATSKTTSLNFLDVDLILKDRVNDYNLDVGDADGTLLATVPNNQLESLYLHVDVSTFPFSNIPQPADTQINFMEVLFKKPLPFLSNDADEFPAKGFDNVLVDKCLEVFFQENGKPDMALLHDQKATRTLARIQEDENRSTEDVVGLVANNHDFLLPTIRPFAAGRRRLYGYGYGARGTYG